MRTRTAHVWLGSTVVACVLGSCAQPHSVSANPSQPEQGSEAAQTPTGDPPSDDSSQAPQKVRDEPAPLDLDLRRLANEFVQYALGDADTFPHWESVSMSLGGHAVKSIDDFHAALSNRDIWKICPADWDSFGASLCPVNFLGPIHEAQVNDHALVFSPVLGDVSCAPPRSGPLPSGRLVVIRPPKMWRSCATDFALALVSDEQGLLRSVDLMRSIP